MTTARDYDSSGDRMATIRDLAAQARAVDNRRAQAIHWAADQLDRPGQHIGHLGENHLDVLDHWAADLHRARTAPTIAARPDRVAEVDRRRRAIVWAAWKIRHDSEAVPA